ncbi:MAG: IS1096 element passenger TnpR family protein [Candidatus Asgardarchaeia archaeon]
MNSLLVVKITLMRYSPTVYRIVEISSDWSLYDFAWLITKLFNFDFDHPFGFYDSTDLGNVQNAFELFVDEGMEPTVKGTLSVKKSNVQDLFEIIGKTAYFLFDYGDEWWFKLELIETKTVKSKKKMYWKLIEKKGTPPPQYPPAEDEEEFEEDIVYIESSYGVDESSEMYLESEEEEEEGIHPDIIKEEFIDFLRKSLKITDSRFDKIIDEFGEIAAKYAPDDYMDNELLLYMGIPVRFLLNKRPNDKNVIDFAIVLIKKTIGLIEQQESELLHQGKYGFTFKLPLDTIYFPIFRLVSCMIATKYPLNAIYDVITSSIFYVHDKVNDVSQLVHIFEYLSKDSMYYDSVALVFLWILMCNQKYLSDENKIKLIKAIEENSKISESWKLILSSYILLISILLTIDNALYFYEIRGYHLRNNETQIIEVLNSFNNSRSESKKSLDINKIQSILTKFVNDFFYYFDNRESISAREISKSIYGLILTSLDICAIYNKIPTQVFKQALYFKVKHLSNKKSVDLLTLLKNIFVLSNEFVKKKYLPIIVDAFFDFSSKINIENAVKHLNELRKDNYYEIRLRAYKALYELTHDDKYLKIALNDRAATIRSWAKSLLTPKNKS